MYDYSKERKVKTISPVNFMFQNISVSTDSAPLLDTR